MPAVFVVRDSGEYKSSLLLGMASKILSPHTASRPDLSEFLEAAELLVQRTPEGEAARMRRSIENLLTETGC